MSSVGGCNWHDSKQTWKDWSCLRNNTEQTFQSDVCDAKQKPHSGWCAGSSEFISAIIKQASAHVNTSSQASKEPTAKWVMICSFFSICSNMRATESHCCLANLLVWAANECLQWSETSTFSAFPISYDHHPQHQPYQSKMISIISCTQRIIFFFDQAGSFRISCCSLEAIYCYGNRESLWTNRTWTRW